jgi:hypothetical protein
MSFDLYLVKKDGSPAPFEDIVRWVSSRPNYSSSANQVMYRNECTGVYFGIDRQDESLDEEYTPPGPGLWVNFLRPDFFAYETMEEITALAQSMDWRTVDPQKENEPKDASKDALVLSWKDSNRNAIAATRDELDPQPTISAKKGDWAWKLNRHYSDNQARATEHIAFMPTIHFLRLSSENFVSTFTVLTIGIGSVIPRCDWIAVVDLAPWWRVWNRGPKVAFVKFETIRETLSKLLLPFGDEYVLPARNSAHAARILRNLKPVLKKGEFERLGADGFVYAWEAS